MLLAEHGALAEAEAAFRRADERGDAVAAFNLGVLLEDRGALAEAEAAYRRADERGDADGAFRLAVLLKERGALDEAAAAYDRASGRGHNAAARDLGVLLVEQGALTDAEAAFTRADERGDAVAAFNLAVLLEERGALAEAEAAYHRAGQRDDEEVANMARAALLDFSQQVDDISAGAPNERTLHRSRRCGAGRRRRQRCARCWLVLAPLLDEFVAVRTQAADTGSARRDREPRRSASATSCCSRSPRAAGAGQTDSQSRASARIVPDDVLHEDPLGDRGSRPAKGGDDR